MIDLEQFLRPIRDDRPCGDDLRLAVGETSLEMAREARREDPADPLPGVAPKEADWRSLREICQRALAEQTKDLELAGYLAEAWTRQEGFAGLAAGLSLVAALLDRHWSVLHPGIDDGEVDEDVRAGPLRRLLASAQLPAAVRQVPLTTAAEGRRLSFADYEASRRVEQAARLQPARHAEMLEAGLPTGDDWRRGFEGTPSNERASTLAQVEASLQALAGLQAACRSHFQEDPSVGLGTFQELLEQIRDLLAKGAAGTEGDPVADADGSDEASRGSEVGEVPQRSGNGALTTRADAARQLRDVAAFLRRTEPHSPVSYLVDRAVAWLAMPFEEVMKDLLKSEDVLGRMREVLGMAARDAGESE